jgi:hypothetical protein
MDQIKELSLTHYTALAVLEQLGLSNPTQEQINTMESMVLLASYPQNATTDTIQQCVGNDKLAYYFLYVKNNEWHKVKGNQEIFLDFKREINREVKAKETLPCTCEY